MVKSSQLSILGGLVAAVGASACCAGPLVLLLMGISGTWISHLTLLDPYRPIFIFAVIVLFGLAGWQIHRPVNDCAKSESCSISKVRARRKVIFWSTALLAFLFVTSNYWIIWLV